MKISLILPLLLCIPFAAQGNPFAHYNGDFSGVAAPTGWRYMWNAPDDWNGSTATDSSTAPFGNPANYNDLIATGAGTWTADGDVDSGNGTPARFLRMNGIGGHPGRGSSQPETTGNAHDRYAIAAYTIQPGDLPGGSGQVFLTASSAGVANVNGGLLVDTHVNGNAINRSFAVAGASSRTFDQHLGALSVGDTVYVGIGPNVSDGNDTFTVDFKLAAASATEAYRIANYRDEFSGVTLPTNWRYLWNAPSDWDGTSSSDGSDGDITSVADFEPLNAVGGTWRVDNDGDPANGSPGRFLGLNGSGGHPGRGAGQPETVELTTPNAHDRYVIAAYDVPLTGIYSVVDTFFSTLTAAGNGSNVRVFTSNSPVSPLADIAFGGSEFNGNFDTPVGMLTAGDTIYVAVGPNNNDGVDSFEFDFSIDYQLIPEPSSALLLGLGALLLCQFRRLRR